MSIAFTTMGKLVPMAAIYREQFTGFDTSLSEVDVIIVQALEIEQMQSVLTTEGLTVELQLLDGATGTLAEENFTVDLSFTCL